MNGNQRHFEQPSDDKSVASDSCVYNRSSMRLINRSLLLLVLVAWVAGCWSGPPLKVTSIQLGRSLNTDGTVGNFTTSFAPTDTIYVSVLTEGSGDATISVRWTFEGRVMGEPKRQVSYKDVAATEFHMQGATGFPTGDYTVEAFMNGQSVGSRPFKVEKR